MDLAAQAGGGRDQAVAVLAEELAVDARLVVEAFERGDGGELEQVLVARLVAGEQHHVVGWLVEARLLRLRPRGATYASTPRMGLIPTALHLL